MSDLMPSVPIVGWNPQLDIPTALGLLSPDELADYVVLTSLIDSTPRVANLASVVSMFDGVAAVCVRVDDDLAVDGPSFVRLVTDKELLFGYDEVSLFSSVPVLGKPIQLRFTSDTRSEPLADDLMDWIIDSGCIAVLRDGDGLHFVTLDAAIAEPWWPCNQTESAP